MNRWKRHGACALAGLMVLGSSMTACAEEITPAGYHVYDVQEGEVSDTWYSIGRGVYLNAGLSKLLESDTDGYAIANGHTLAHSKCDRVYVRVYLDESDNGTDGWGTIDYWTGEAFEASMVSVNSGDYKITSGKYYRVTGVHSATEGETVETTGTCTNALLF